MGRARRYFFVKRTFCIDIIFEKSYNYICDYLITIKKGAYSKHYNFIKS